MWNIGNGKLEVILSEMAVVFGKWSNARASLEKLRDKAHGEGKGPKTVAYTPKEPKMIIRCSFVFI